MKLSVNTQNNGYSIGRISGKILILIIRQKRIFKQISVGLSVRFRLIEEFCETDNPINPIQSAKILSRNFLKKFPFRKF